MKVFDYENFSQFPEALRPAFPRLKDKLEDSEPGKSKWRCVIELRLYLKNGNINASEQRLLCMSGQSHRLYKKTLCLLYGLFQAKTLYTRYCMNAPENYTR